jgi:enoyl-CoA hydratase/carnithine racemase
VSRIFEVAPDAELLPELLDRLDAAGAAGAAAVLVFADSNSGETRLPDHSLRALARFELPVVFALEGAIKGGIAELALAADIRVCSEGASLQGRLAANSRIRSVAEEGAALALVFGREALGSAELLRTGLVSSVVANGQAFAEGRRVAEVIASRGPVATRLAKEAIWRGLGQPLEQALRFETDLTLLLQTTKDRAEGVRAFLEKRPPNFTGE